MKRVSCLAAAASLLALAAGCLPDAVGPPTPTDDPTSITTRGQAIASASCASCHGGALRGDTTSGVRAPSLIVVKDYTWGQFDTLLCAGLTRDAEASFGPMPTNGQFGLTPAERQVLYVYLAEYWRP
jgi:hypothetical protein